jgi:site-specific DNA-methyltransferase (adenine-specific)
MNESIVCMDNLAYLSSTPDESFRLVYMDPPFNTGKTRRLTPESELCYPDKFEDYIGFLRPRLEETRRVLTNDGSLYLHVGTQYAHHIRMMLDEVFGAECFVNEIIWAYDYGGRSKRTWPRKHQNIYLYVKDPDSYLFNREEVERIPYMAPGLAGEEKAAKGKFPTDVWWHTIVPPASKDRTGYPDQKPVALVERAIRASSLPGDVVLDPFCGSGTTAIAAVNSGRGYVLVDENPQAVEVAKRRLNA